MDVATPTLPHLAGVTWRLDVPRASRSSAAQPQSSAEGPCPVYSVRLSLAHIHPTAFSASARQSVKPQQQQQQAADDGGEEKQQQQQQEAAAAGSEGVPTQQMMQARLEDVAFSCTPETLLALADAIEAAVKQSEQGPYRRILRLIR